MKQDKYHRPRLSIEITGEQQKGLQRLIPWGLLRQVFSPIVDDVIRLANKHGQVFIAAVLEKDIKLEDYSSVELKKDALDLGGPGCQKCILDSYPGKVIQTVRDLEGHWSCSNCGRVLGYGND